MQTDFSRPILAMDTSTAYLSLAIFVNEKMYEYHELVGNKHSNLILPKIGELLAKAQISVADLGAIVYAKGAGAFTGLRIGLGVAQGLATPFDTPLMGVPCQDAVASLLPENVCVLAATDARMGEIFYAFFNTKTHERLSNYGVANWQDIVLPNNFSREQIMGIGNAFALPDAKNYFSGSEKMPTAADYLRLAMSGKYEATAPELAELLYIRNKIALTAAEQAARKFQAA